MQVRRISCGACKAFWRERLGFCPEPNLAYTKWLAQFVLALRKGMSISAVAQFTGLHWDTVKEIEKSYLARKRAKVGTGAARRLGIDEVYLGKTFGFITVVRDLEGGKVLFVGKGKGGDALKPFEPRLRRKSSQIEAVAVDMSNAYAAWLARVLPDADIVYDRFHVIKLMNERMDGLLGFWKHGRITSASQEGFNIKIGWLTRQDYGYRDEAFLHLKIYDLPNLSTRMQL